MPACTACRWILVQELQSTGRKVAASIPAWWMAARQISENPFLFAFPTLSPYSKLASSGFVVVQGPKPKNAALSRDDDAAYPQNAVVRAKLGKVKAPGLISGTVDYEAGDFCPAHFANRARVVPFGRADSYSVG